MELSSTENAGLDREKYRRKPHSSKNIETGRILTLLLLGSVSQNLRYDDKAIYFGTAAGAGCAGFARHEGANNRYCPKIRVFFSGGFDESLYGGVRLRTGGVQEKSRTPSASHTLGGFLSRTGL